jgi:hypothetical protein
MLVAEETETPSDDRTADVLDKPLEDLASPVPKDLSVTFWSKFGTGADAKAIYMYRLVLRAALLTCHATDITTLRTVYD